MNIINIIDEKIAEKLKSKGFKYKKEIVGDTTIFSFIRTDELETFLKSNFSTKDYFVSKYARFKNKERRSYFEK